MTPPTNPHDRLTEIKSIHRDYHNFYQLLRGVVLVAVLAGIGVLIFSSDLPSYWQNIYVTIVGAIGTVLIIDQRAEQRAIRQRKEELIAQMGSRSNAFALEAVRLLRSKKWLMDGSMNGANLSRGELENAELQFADLQLVDMTETNLKKTNFDLTPVWRT
ncbi:MAG: pentapeptide repeat-containing protein [Anaerolineae bacterium]|nr:pentapeptide repeat-containing protein [Anaerolineae bacterium]